MPLITRTNPAGYAANTTGGSNDLRVYLTLAQAQAAFGATDPAALAGWHKVAPALVPGTELGPDRQSNKIYDEAGGLVDEPVETDALNIQFQGFEASARTLNFFEYLEGVDVPWRYLLPLGKDGRFHLDADGDKFGQVWAGKRARMQKDGWRINTQRAATRTPQRTLVASVPEDGSRIYHVYDLKTEVQTGWPAALAFAKDTPA